MGQASAAIGRRTLAAGYDVASQSAASATTVYSQIQRQHQDALAEMEQLYQQQQPSLYSRAKGFILENIRDKLGLPAIAPKPVKTGIGEFLAMQVKYQLGIPQKDIYTRQVPILGIEFASKNMPGILERLLTSQRIVTLKQYQKPSIEQPAISTIRQTPMYVSMDQQGQMRYRQPPQLPGSKQGYEHPLDQPSWQIDARAKARMAQQQEPTKQYAMAQLADQITQQTAMVRVAHKSQMPKLGGNTGTRFENRYLFGLVNILVPGKYAQKRAKKYVAKKPEPKPTVYQYQNIIQPVKPVAQPLVIPTYVSLDTYRQRPAPTKSTWQDIERDRYQETERIEYVYHKHDQSDQQLDLFAKQAKSETPEGVRVRKYMEADPYQQLDFFKGQIIGGKKPTYSEDDFKQAQTDQDFATQRRIPRLGEKLQFGAYATFDQSHVAKSKEHIRHEIYNEPETIVKDGRKYTVDSTAISERQLQRAAELGYTGKPTLVKSTTESKIVSKYARELLSYLREKREPPSGKPKLTRVDEKYTTPKPSVIKPEPSNIIPIEFGKESKSGRFGYNERKAVAERLRIKANQAKSGVTASIDKEGLFRIDIAKPKSVADLEAEQKKREQQQRRSIRNRIRALSRQRKINITTSKITNNTTDNSIY